MEREFKSSKLFKASVKKEPGMVIPEIRQEACEDQALLKMLPSVSVLVKYLSWVNTLLSHKPASSLQTQMGGKVMPKPPSLLR